MSTMRPKLETTPSATAKLHEVNQKQGAINHQLDQQGQAQGQAQAQSTNLARGAQQVADQLAKRTNQQSDVKQATSTPLSPTTQTPTQAASTPATRAPLTDTARPSADVKKGDDPSLRSSMADTARSQSTFETAPQNKQLLNDLAKSGQRTLRVPEAPTVPVQTKSAAVPVDPSKNNVTENVKIPIATSQPNTQAASTVAVPIPVAVAPTVEGKKTDGAKKEAKNEQTEKSDEAGETSSADEATQGLGSLVAGTGGKTGEMGRFIGGGTSENNESDVQAATIQAAGHVAITEPNNAAHLVAAYGKQLENMITKINELVRGVDSHVVAALSERVGDSKLAQEMYRDMLTSHNVYDKGLKA